MIHWNKTMPIQAILMELFKSVRSSTETCNTLLDILSSSVVQSVAEIATSQLLLQLLSMEFENPDPVD